MDPDFRQAHRYLGGVYVMKHRFDDAIAEFKMARASGEWDPGFVTYAYGMAGRKAEAKEMLDVFCDVMIQIAWEAETNAAPIHEAPVTTAVRRLDQTKAAREPNLKWTRRS